MSKTIFFKDYIVYKPDIIKIDEEIIVDNLINCKGNCFHSFKFLCICKVKIKNIRNKRIFIKEIRDDGLIKKRIEVIIFQKKTFWFIEIDKLIIKCRGDFSNNNMSYYMSLKIPFISRLFFQKITHKREYINTYCIDLDNEFNFICCRWYQKNNLDEALPFGGYICHLDSFF